MSWPALPDSAVLPSHFAARGASPAQPAALTRVGESASSFGSIRTLNGLGVIVGRLDAPYWGIDTHSSRREGRRGSARPVPHRRVGDQPSGKDAGGLLEQIGKDAGPGICGHVILFLSDLRAP